MTTGTIIVATDGAESSLGAVAWAAREAERRHGVLRIVHAYERDWVKVRPGGGSDYVDIARQVAEGIVATARDRARQVAPGIAIQTNLLIGHAVPCLLEVSHGGDLFVVGSRGRGGFAGLLLGSVSASMATNASCPVVVVRGRTEGPIVAGVDENPAAEVVLEAAFAAAAEWNAPLLVIRAYPPAVPLWVAAAGVADVIDTSEQENDERARLDEQLAPWREKYSAVPVKAMVTREGAAAALVAASGKARLVVVGSRGHGRVSGALLGSVGLQLLHHAESPVLIVRHDDRAGA
ncbi:universal stress protein [Actinoplanes sp. NPDC024001]|uniref:universal stress protein n=1 Tax=unclassified Actinoplanes TaxID=2626549 RepID=UPI002E1FAAFD